MFLNLVSQLFLPFSPVVLHPVGLVSSSHSVYPHLCDFSLVASLEYCEGPLRNANGELVLETSKA